MDGRDGYQLSTPLSDCEEEEGAELSGRGRGTTGRRLAASPAAALSSLPAHSVVAAALPPPLQLVLSILIDQTPETSENDMLAQSITSLAMEKGLQPSFMEFQVLFAGVIIGEGVGRTRREAQQQAAEGSLLYLEVARELFYYLKGGQVDYREEHSKVSHSQFGRVYERGIDGLVVMKNIFGIKVPVKTKIRKENKFTCAYDDEEAAARGYDVAALNYWPWKISLIFRATGSGDLGFVD
ncbi:hypothetical protein OROMI_003797 [Orobanche minor]